MGSWSQGTGRYFRSINFSCLKAPRSNYATQEHMQQERVDMADACFLHYGGEVGSVLRYCGGEYTAAHQDQDKLLDKLRPHIPQDDLYQIKRGMKQGCPAKFVKEFDKSNKVKMIKRGNRSSLDKNPEVVATTMNKEDKNSHVIPVSSIFIWFTAFAHHVAQTLNMKKLAIRMCWDGTNKDHPDHVHIYHHLWQYLNAIPDLTGEQTNFMAKQRDPYRHSRHQGVLQMAQVTPRRSRCFLLQYRLHGFVLCIGCNGLWIQG